MSRSLPRGPAAAGRSPPAILVNTPRIELWPASLCQTRRSDQARLLALADVVLRRKSDGRWLAALQRRKLQPLIPGLEREPGLEQALAAQAGFDERQGRSGSAAPGTLPATETAADNLALGLARDYADRSGLPFHAEPRLLHYAGRDRFRRALWLLAPAARAWRSMRDAAAGDGIALDAISGWRSHAYQRRIFDRKLARGLTLDAILEVNAAPGHSEHHSGRALDLGTPGQPPAEAGFETTAAYAWLSSRAGGFGFRLSYPRGNPHGIQFEPWHWCWHPPSG